MKIGKIEASQMNQKCFISDKGVEITYYKPSQVREIPLKQRSVRGYIPSLKLNMKGNVLNYESQLERDFLYLLDQDPNCIDIQTQPCHVHYTTKNNRKVKATPDVWAIFQDGCQYLFEVKPEKKLKELEKDENWQLKTKAIIQYCENHPINWEYRIITEGLDKTRF